MCDFFKKKIINYVIRIIKGKILKIKLRLT